MRPNLTSLAKLYLVFFGFINLFHVASLLSFNETMANAPPYLNFLGWHIILSLVYGVFPIITVLIDNEKSYIVLTAVSLIGVLIEALNVFTWVTNLSFMYAFLNSLAAILSSYLAVENVAIKIAAEILDLEWGTRDGVR